MTKRAFTVYYIDRHHRRRTIAVRQGEKMREVLLRYYEEVLRPKGYSNPLISGSVMSLDKDGNTHLFSVEDKR